MNLTDFTDDLASEFNLTKETSRKIIMFLLKNIRERIIFGEEVSLRGIGRFILKIRPATNFLNIQTLEMNVSKKSYYLKFKVFANLKKRIKDKTVY